MRAPYGDFWSGTVPIAGTPPAVAGSAWGTPGRYVYRYTIANPNVGTLDWIIDPFAREFGVGKLSAFTLGYQPYVWSAAEAQWRTPALSDLILYEINIAEFGGDLERTRNRHRLPRGPRRQRDRDHAAVERRRLGRLGLSADRLLRRRRALRQALRLPGSSSISATSTASR